MEWEGWLVRRRSAKSRAIRRWKGIADKKSASIERMVEARERSYCGWIGVRKASRPPSALVVAERGEKKVKRESGKRATMRLIRSPMSGDPVGSSRNLSR